MIQHPAAAQLVDAEVILFGMCQRHALESVRFFLQMDAEHTEHTAGAPFAGGDEPAVPLHNLTVYGRVGDAGHAQIRQHITLQPERYGLGLRLFHVESVAAGFQVGHLPPYTLAGHGSHDGHPAAFPDIAVKRALFHHLAAVIRNGKRRVHKEAPFHVPFIVPGGRSVPILTVQVPDGPQAAFSGVVNAF